MEPKIPIDKAKIAEFCQKWKITEFSLFGSVLTDDFREGLTAFKERRSPIYRGR